jgi:hypothetical protein
MNPGQGQFVLGFYNQLDNNIIVNNVLIGGKNQVLKYSISNLITNEMHNNAYYAHQGNNFFNGQIPLEQWHSQYDPIGTGSIELPDLDSVFVDAQNHDFTLIENSPLIDIGADAGISEDFNGMGRPIGIGYDIGAYESEFGVDCDEDSDLDDDGYDNENCGGNDCNDNNPNINPSAAEICGDGKDNDCSNGDKTCAACPQGQISARCDCEGEIKEDGFCCYDGWRDSACPDICQNDQLITQNCLCGTEEVVSGYCCNGASRTTPCPDDCQINVSVSADEPCLCGTTEISSGYCCQDDEGSFNAQSQHCLIECTDNSIITNACMCGPTRRTGPGGYCCDDEYQTTECVPDCAVGNKITEVPCECGDTDITQSIFINYYCCSDGTVKENACDYGNDCTEDEEIKGLCYCNDDWYEEGYCCTDREDEDKLYHSTTECPDR